MLAMAVLPRHLSQIRSVGCGCGVCGFAFQESFARTALGVVLAYQLVGMLGEWATKGDFWLAAQDFRIGIPGMLLQIFGSWLFINRIIRK